jgi:uncharacterized membrane protein YqjE
MDSTTNNLGQLADTSKRVAGRLMTIVENRLELLMVEVQEERERLLRVILLALGAAVFGLLAGVALTVAIVIFFWERSPITALLVLTILYGAFGTWLFVSFTRLQRDWQTLPDTIEQLRKDRECLERGLT